MYIWQNCQTHNASTEGVPLLDEEIELENHHPSWLNWLKAITAAICIGGYGLIGVSLGDIGASIPFVASGILIIDAVVLSRRRSRYVVTTNRVYTKVGLLRRTISEARIADIHSLSTEESLLERLAGEGTVRIDSTGISGLMTLTGTTDHEHFANTIRQQQQAVSE